MKDFEQKVVDLYQKQEKSTYQIAEELNTYPNKIRRVLIKHGVEIKDRSSAQKLALKKGRSKHPTDGITRDEETKIKISSQMVKHWDQLDDEEVEVDLSRLADLTDDEELGLGDDEEIELPDDLEGIEKLVAEALNVDYKPEPHGDVGGGSEIDYEAAIDMALTKAMSDEMQEENEELQSALEELQEEVAQLKLENKKFKSVKANRGNDGKGTKKEG